MKPEERIVAFSQLGKRIDELSEKELNELCGRAQSINGWFTEANVRRAIAGIGLQLNAMKLESWLKTYPLNQEIPRIVGIVMAGNIPLVGFHDLMCVLLSGHFAAVKTSSEDSFLVKWIVEMLLNVEPRFKKSIEFREKLTNTDAVIATGSDNTARYFEYYFRGVPHIIRKNRTSLGVLDGTETTEELEKLGTDILSYFGLGCRNVSKLLIPVGYKPDAFYEAIQSLSFVGDHHKYRNNYDYNKSIYLVNKEPHLDNGFLLWRKSEDLVSPISVIYIQEYAAQSEIDSFIQEYQEKIQCVVGHGYIPFGQAQSPEPWEYADNVDTMRFLSGL